jgi:hypothetical protein
MSVFSTCSRYPQQWFFVIARVLAVSSVVAFALSLLFFVGGAVGAVCFNGDVGDDGDDGDDGGCEAADIPTTCSPVTL